MNFDPVNSGDIREVHFVIKAYAVPTAVKYVDKLLRQPVRRDKRSLGNEIEIMNTPQLSIPILDRVISRSPYRDTALLHRDMKSHFESTDALEVFSYMNCSTNKLMIGDREGFFTVTCKPLSKEHMDEMEQKFMEILDLMDEIVWYQKETPLVRHRRNLTLKGDLSDQMKTTWIESMNDPLLEHSWHIINPNVDGAQKFGLNLFEYWAAGYYGQGIRIALVDDGVDFEHPDLSHAFDLKFSWDFVDNTPLVPPFNEEDKHGTRCAGQIFSKHNNSVCGIGVSPAARMSAIRLISSFTYDSKEASALTFNYHSNHIFSASWGPQDDGKSMDGPGDLTRGAILEGVINGRSGKGSIYVMASGNGGFFQDICTVDGYANSIYTISIGAVDEELNYPPYSEVCSAQLAVTFGGTQRDGIATTDFLQKDRRNGEINERCTLDHHGTSAATPFASGMLSLVLQQNGNLNWRDVQHIVVKSASPIRMNDPGWSKTGSGRQVHYYYGFGLLQGNMLLETVNSHKMVPDSLQLVISSNENLGLQTKSKEILELQILCCRSAQWKYPKTGLSVESKSLPKSMAYIEHVQLYIKLDHSSRKDLTITLVSPSGLESLLLHPRPLDKSEDGLSWTFMSVRHWGENSEGAWTIKVKDDSLSGGTLESWKLTFNGIPCAEKDWILDPTSSRYSCKWEAEFSQSTYDPYVLVGLLFGVSVLFIVLYVLYNLYKRRKNSGFTRLDQKQRKSLERIINVPNFQRSVSLQEVPSAGTKFSPLNNQTRREAALDDTMEMTMEASVSSPSPMRRTGSGARLAPKDRPRPAFINMRRFETDLGQLPSPMIVNPLQSPFPLPSTTSRNEGQDRDGTFQ